MGHFHDTVPFTLVEGSLRNDDGDVNENGKKGIRLYWQNNNCARATRFFVYFFAIIARLRRENISRFVENVNTRHNKDKRFSFSFPELR